MKRFLFTLTLLYPLAWCFTVASACQTNRYSRSHNNKLQRLDFGDSLPDTTKIVAVADSLQGKLSKLDKAVQKGDSLTQVLNSKIDKISNTKPVKASYQKVTEKITSNTSLVANTATLKPHNSGLVPPTFTHLTPSHPTVSVSEIAAELAALGKVAEPNLLAQQLSNYKEKVAKQQLVAQKERIRQAERRLDRYKSRFEKIEDIDNLPKTLFMVNPLKGRPWQERIVLGTLWQFSNQKTYKLDVGPSLAWLFTDKIAFGAGGQYRLSINVREKPWVSSLDKVLGFYAFSDIEVYKGFFGRVQYEHLNTDVPRFDASGQVEYQKRKWVKGFSVGIGKSYSFYKQLRGFALMQYNFLYESRETPYLQPMQAKIGFYIHSKHLLRVKK